MGDAVVQLFIYHRTISERCNERDREWVNAIKDMYWGIRATYSQWVFAGYEGMKIGTFYNFLMYPENIDWLWQHFHKNGHLLSAEIHEAYHTEISNTKTQTRLLNPDNVPPILGSLLCPVRFVAPV